jgi:Spy/CpxP family protein refolding chaperone
MNAEEMAEKRAERMAATYELNQTQKEQLKALFTEQAIERKALMADRREQKMDRSGRDSTQRMEKRQERMAAQQEKRAEMEEKMKSILTPEQFEKWKANASADNGKKYRKGPKRMDRSKR